MATDHGEPSGYPPIRVNGRGPGWYRGDCHLHSVYSNGAKLTPEQLTTAAREVGLDFIATTEHNTAEGHGSWGRHAGDDLLVILGQEVTTPTGHWLALGLRPGQQVDGRYRAGDGLIDRHLRQVRRSGGLCVVAHPYAPSPSGTFEYPYDGFDAVEVWNGPWASDRPWQADNAAALDEWDRALTADVHDGRWRPAIGNSDTHLPDQVGTPQTVVFAEELSTEAILSGLRAGRSWIAGSADVELRLDVRAGDRSAGLGERLATGGAPALVRARVSGVPAGTISFHTDRGRVHPAALAEAGSEAVGWRTSARQTAFVRVEVRHPGGGLAALSNPIVLV